MEFKKYQHIERFGTDEVDGIEIGKCYIFPKIDGTNSSVWINNGELKAGSRNRELTLEKDNAGFYAWVLNNKEMFMPYFEKHPTHRLYGEWLVPHTLKNYRDSAWRNFYIFDVATDGENDTVEYLPYDIYKEFLEEFNLEYIVPQKIITNPTIDDLNWELEQNHYLMAKSDDVGEGIVIKNYDFYNKYSRQTWAKIVRSEFKERHYKTMGVPEKVTKLIEEEIAQEFVTTALVEKEKSKIENECGGWSSKYIARLLSVIYYSIASEDMWHILKKYKNPKIDFKLLNNFIIKEIKNKCPTIFG